MTDPTTNLRNALARRICRYEANPWDDLNAEERGLYEEDAQQLIDEVLIEHRLALLNLVGAKRSPWFDCHQGHAPQTMPCVTPVGTCNCWSRPLYAVPDVADA